MRQGKEQVPDLRAVDGAEEVNYNIALKMAYLCKQEEVSVER